MKVVVRAIGNDLRMDYTAAPVGLGLAHDHGANIRGIADEQRVPEALHERMKPDDVAGALNPD